MAAQYVIAHDEVFNTTELLELIMLNLPLKDMLLLQRVNQFWKDTVLGSVKLQRWLFFRPIVNIEDNPSPAFFVNPIAGTGGSFDLLQSSSEPSSMPSDDDEPMQRHYASWRRMYLTQAPIRKVVLHSGDSFYGTYNRPLTRTRINLSGVTLFDAFQLAGEMRMYCEIVDWEQSMGSMRKVEEYGQLEETRMSL